MRENLDERSRALVDLGRALVADAYTFVTVTPATHARVDRRARAAGRYAARSLRDVFGWSRPFEPHVVPAAMRELMQAANVLVETPEGLRSKVRFSTARGELFVHSAYPTEDEDSVFFGPDTYRFCDLVAAHAGSAAVVVDVGCGSGAGGIVAAASRRDVRLVLADVNETTLAFARVNAILAGVDATITQSDVLDGVHDRFDVVIANPPYLVDPKARDYRDGSGDYGETLGARIVRDALARLDHGGRLVVYTGSAIVDGRDVFRDAVASALTDARARWRHWEIDPDVFGEEIERNEAYADVERIAAVALVAEVP